VNKPRMVTPNDDELPALLAYGPGDLGAPTLYKVADGWRADAGEMERWRAGLQHTSGVPHE
jgi:hypothetical protein